MSAAKIAFLKLIVTNLPLMQDFYETAFGFSQVDVVDTADFEEILLRQGDDPFLLMLLRYKSGGRAGDATAHGPTGFVSNDVQASVNAALAAGATLKLAPFDVGPTKVAFVADPEGHEIEIIQFL